MLLFDSLASSLSNRGHLYWIWTLVTLSSIPDDYNKYHNNMPFTRHNIIDDNVNMMGMG